MIYTDGKPTITSRGVAAPGSPSKRRKPAHGGYPGDVIAGSVLPECERCGRAIVTDNLRGAAPGATDHCVGVYHCLRRAK